MSGFHSNVSPHLHLFHPTLRFRNSAVTQPQQLFCEEGHCSASVPSAGTLAYETVMLPELCGKPSFCQGAWGHHGLCLRGFGCCTFKYLSLLGIKEGFWLASPLRHPWWCDEVTCLWYSRAWCHPGAVPRAMQDGWIPPPRDHWPSCHRLHLPFFQLLHPSGSPCRNISKTTCPPGRQQCLAALQEP